MAKFNGNEVKLYAEISGGGGGGISEVFNVEYMVTPFSDIYSAIEAGKICVINYVGNTYYACTYSENNIVFSNNGLNGQHNVIYCNKNNDWGNDTQNLLTAATKVTEITSESTYGQVASAKAVYDAISAAIADIEARLGIQ